MEDLYSYPLNNGTDRSLHFLRESATAITADQSIPKNPGLKVVNLSNWIVASGSAVSYEPNSVYDSFTTEQTLTFTIDEEMNRLRRASEEGKAEDFVCLYRRMDWSFRPGLDYIKAIKLALAAGAPLMARHLANEGSARFPDNLELVKMSSLLAPPKVIGLQPAEPTNAQNILWLKAHSEEYRGRWIALRGGELLASAETFHALTLQIGNPKNTGILVTRIY
jgi:hypothetical protein